MTDFEEGLANAFNEVFNSTMKGCYFHFIKRIYAYICALHQKREYDSGNEDVTMFTKSVMALPNLPQRLFDAGLAELQRQAGDVQWKKDLLTKVQSVWMHRHVVAARVSIEDQVHRTNNFVESFVHMTNEAFQHLYMQHMNVVIISECKKLSRLFD